MRILLAWKSLRLGVGLLLGILTAPALLVAANHYVRAGATGNGSGSDWTNAYTDLPSTLARGDTYYIAAGSYAPNGYTFDDPESGSEVITVQTATVADHGTNIGWSDAYAGQVVLHNVILKTGYYTISGAYRTGWEGTYGMEVVLLPPLPNNDNAAFWFYGSSPLSHITIKYVDMPGYGLDSGFAPQYGIYAQSGDPAPGGSYTYITVQYCYIHDEGPGAAPFQLNWDSNWLVEYTEFARITNDPGWHGEMVTDEGPSNNITYRYNRFIDTWGSGVIVILTPAKVSTEQNWYIYGNLFWQQTYTSNSVGDGVIDCLNHQICSNWYIYNNTFANFSGGVQGVLPSGIGWFEADTSSTNISVYDNIWYNSRNVDFSESTSGQINHDYNYYINSTGYPTESHGETGSANIFNNVAGGDFHLTTETADGLHLSSPYDIDPDGVKRGSDNRTWSRGVYQYAPNSASSPQPPTNLTVASVH